MSTAPDAQERIQSAPYVAFKTFKNFIKSLHENGLPSHIDKSVMTGLSGGVQSHLASAIRFLGLVKADLTPTEPLETLVDSYDSDHWKDNLSALIKESYADVIDGVDLSNATPDQLDKRFGSQSAVMIDKSVRFLLSALDDAEMEYSSHLKKRKPKAKRKSRPKQKEDVKPSSANTSSNSVDTSSDVIEYPIPFGDSRKGVIIVPSDITTEDCEMMDLVLPLIRKLAERNS